MFDSCVWFLPRKETRWLGGDSGLTTSSSKGNGGCISPVGGVPGTESAVI